jgi:hypothetical protein
VASVNSATYWTTARSIESLKDILGRSWFDKEAHRFETAQAEGRDRIKRGGRQSKLKIIRNASGRALPCHPLAMMLWNASMALRSGRLDVEASTASALEAMLSRLIAARAHGLDERLCSLISKHHTEYEKTLFEIAIADRLLRKGSTVAFVPTQRGMKTPDIIANDAIEIECKLPDPLGEQAKKNNGCWDDVMALVTDAMHRHRVYCAVRVDVLSNPTPEQARRIATTLSDAIANVRTGTLDLVDGGTACLAVVMQGNAAKSMHDPQLISCLAGVGISMQHSVLDFRTLDESDYGYMGWTAPRNHDWIANDFAAFTFRSAVLPDRRVAAQNLIRQAREQFSRERPALICIGYHPAGNRSRPLTPAELDGIADEIVPGSETISGVLFIGGHPLAAEADHAAHLYRNRRARLPLPPNLVVE